MASEKQSDKGFWHNVRRSISKRSSDFSRLVTGRIHARELRKALEAAQRQGAEVRVVHSADESAVPWAIIACLLLIIFLLICRLESPHFGVAFVAVVAVTCYSYWKVKAKPVKVTSAATTGVDR
eukprot:scaffold3321_cov220-Pinguiococcus_pyrenoidosus.AAC.2